MLLHMPRKLGGDIGHEKTAGTKTVVMAPHPEFTVLAWECSLFYLCHHICTPPWVIHKPALFIGTALLTVTEV